MKRSKPMSISLMLICVILLLCGVVVAAIFECLVVVLALVLIVLIFSVIIAKRHSKTLKQIAVMLDAVDNEDLSFRFSRKEKPSQEDTLLNASLDRIKEMVLSARVVAKEQERYFETILDQSNMGIVVINLLGVVYRVNEPALSSLQLSRLTHLSQLQSVDRALYLTVESLQNGQNKRVAFYNDSCEVNLNIYCSEMTLQQQEVKVLLISDISSEVDNAEIDNWHRISRVLTHEIMNSLTPITSLSQSLVKSTDGEFIQRGLQVIADTSDSLMKFVDNYRRLTKISKPQLEEINIVELVRGEAMLLATDIEIVAENEIFMVMADRAQIAQVFINLIKNALEACSVADRTDAKVWINVMRVRGVDVCVEVCNTGVPISEEVREDIFVPFFTTKEGGNGIGLSLSRQIMRLHEGTITLITEPYTRFRVIFSQ